MQQRRPSAAKNKHIFKKSFLDGFAAADINIYTATIAMAITCLLAFYIFLAYRLLTRKTFYSKNFNISLVGIALITAGILALAFLGFSGVV